MSALAKETNWMREERERFRPEDLSRINRCNINVNNFSSWCLLLCWEAIFLKNSSILVNVFIYSFIYLFLNDTINSSDCIKSSGRIISVQVIGKDVEGNSNCIILVPYRHFPGGTMENSNENSQSPGLGWNPYAPRYKAGVLSSRPRSSMVLCKRAGLSIISISLNVQRSCAYE
jgi:hypothetical protein